MPDEDNGNNNDPLPMVVTPAHSSDDPPRRSPLQQQHPTHPLLLDLWQGRKPTIWRTTPDPRPAMTYPTFVDNESSLEESSSPSRQSPVFRITGMIQDIAGEVEYLCRQEDGTYFERQAVVVVTDYDDATVGMVDSSTHSPDQQRSAKRPRRSRSSSMTTTATATILGMYVYWHHDSSNSSNIDDNYNCPPRNGLQLHQIIEWIAVRDPADDDNEQETEDLLRLQHRRFDMMNDDNDDYHLFHPPTWGWSMDSSSPETQRHATTPHHLQYWHAVTATPRTMDGLWLERQRLSPLGSSSLLLDQGPPSAILFMAEHLNVSTTVATALWLTLLARAEPTHHSPVNNHAEQGITMTPPTTLIGCTSLTFTLPEAFIPAWKHALQRLLQPALPLMVNVTDTMPPPQVIQQPHSGRLGRQAWQFPPGTTILWDQSKTNVSSSLLQQFQIPLHCEGGQVCWLPADWRLLVIQASSSLYHNATAATKPATCTNATSGGSSISLEGWTPTAATTAVPIPVDRHQQWARTLAVLRETIPTVTLDPTLTSDVSQHVVAYRSSTKGRVATTTTWARWWTWTRLWARAHGRTTAVQADWDQALALDAALGWS